MAVLAGIVAFSACSPGQTTIDGFGTGAQRLRVVNRTATRIQDRNGVRLSAASGNGVAWVEGTDFRSGTIEVDIRGREFMGQNFVGVAFHRKNDNTYEAVYLRPFNFRARIPSASSTRSSTSRCRSSTMTAFAKSSPRSSKTQSMPRSCPPTGSSSAWSLRRQSSDLCGRRQARSRSKCGSLASSMAARSGCGWATSAAGTSRISSSRRRNNDVAGSWPKTSSSHPSSRLSSTPPHRHRQPLTAARSRDATAASSARS